MRTGLRLLRFFAAVSAASIVGALFVDPVALHAAAVDAARLLADSDRGFGGDVAASGLTWTAKVSNTERGKTVVQTFLIRARGDNARVETLEPEKQRGDVLLFNDRTLWFHRPGLRKPVTVSARQRLSGRAANGDVAFTRFVRDYDPTLAGEDKVLDQPVWKLELKAKSKQVTYDSVRYYISQKSKLGIRAEFLTLEGKVFKSAEYRYDNTLLVDGKPRPYLSRVTIRDATYADVQTVIEVSDPKIEAHPPETFDVKGLAVRKPAAAAASPTPGR